MRIFRVTYYDGFEIDVEADWFDDDILRFHFYKNTGGLFGKTKVASFRKDNLRGVVEKRCIATIE